MQVFSAIEYLKMDIACNHLKGLDKKDWVDRLDWFDNNEHQLRKLVATADKDGLFLGGVIAYENYLKGVPSGYAISLDATSSAIQILACLSGDVQAAKLCNVIDVGRAVDAYMEIYSHMVDALGTASTLNRDKLKKPIMTSIYGSKKEPKQIFGEDTPEYNQFLTTVSVLLPLVWKLKDSLIDLWQDDVLSHDITMPDGFQIHLPVMDEITENFYFNGEVLETSYRVNRAVEYAVNLAANITHGTDGLGVREMDRAANYDPDMFEDFLELPYVHGKDKKDSPNNRELVRLLKIQSEHSYTSLRLVEYITAKNIHLVPPTVYEELVSLVELSLAHEPFKIMSIHDCFRCLPKYGNHMRKHYNQFLYRLAKSTIVQAVAREVTGNPRITYTRPDISEMVLDADYQIS